jgi:putative NIF3 family GTP cyclohydrolase 1 type 2
VNFVKAHELLTRILDASPWVDRETTVDRIVDGRPGKELNKVLAVWRCSADTLETAIREGYDGILVHEPTYYFHRDEAKNLAAMPEGSPKKETARHKQEFIRKHDLTVIRIHDAWDSRDGIGVAASWAKSLGLTNRVYKSEPPDCECRYDIKPVAAGMFLETVRDAVKGYQIPAPVLFGDPAQSVSRVGVGAGCIASLERFIQMGCDIAIVCDDGLWYWADIAFALDRDFPVIRVSHAASEEAGIRSLAEWVQAEFGIMATYIREKTNQW